MGIWSWLFPTGEARLAQARALMAEGRHKKARDILLHHEAPEAEALYDQCCAALEGELRESTKKRLAAQGFHGFRVEVELKSARRKKELEDLVTQELARAGIDLGVPDIDQDALKAAVQRAQRRMRGAGGREAPMVKLVPIVK
jgi:hypothetical protein